MTHVTFHCANCGEIRMNEWQRKQTATYDEQTRMVTITVKVKCLRCGQLTVKETRYGRDDYKRLGR